MYCCIVVLVYCCVVVLLCWCVVVLLCCLCLRELWYVVVMIDRNCDVLPISLDDLLNYTTLMLMF
jgi:hypothetical protein